MKFVVLGAGAWGTAIAVHLARVGQDVTLVPRREEHASALEVNRENREYLPGIGFPQELRVSQGTVPSAADVLLLGTPMAGLREWCGRARSAKLAPPPRLVLSLAKGLEVGTHLRASEVIAAELPGIDVGTLTGPSFADEVARGLPAALVLATAGHSEFAGQVQVALSGPSFGVYTSSDIVGAELGGALKNIYAIASGCSDGLRLGENTRAALMTRALAEMIRLGNALGARTETLYGLSGFGDLVLTCGGRLSRNHEFGRRLGEGATIDELLKGRKTVVEGYRTAESMHGLCRERGLEAPILEQIYKVLFEGLRPAHGLHALMTRGLRRETDER
jgi:glycerol-3-phosphate dehydrogenase (NAD(P)+)